MDVVNFQLLVLFRCINVHLSHLVLHMRQLVLFLQQHFSYHFAEENSVLIQNSLKSVLLFLNTFTLECVLRFEFKHTLQVRLNSEDDLVSF